MAKTHVRDIDDSTSSYCGRPPSESISLRHYETQQPHVRTLSLPICVECVQAIEALRLRALLRRTDG